MEPETVGSKLVVSRMSQIETGARGEPAMRSGFISFLEPLLFLPPFQNMHTQVMLRNPFPVGLFPNRGYSWAEGPHVEVINVPVPFSPTEFTDQRPCQHGNG